MDRKWDVLNGNISWGLVIQGLYNLSNSVENPKSSNGLIILEGEVYSFISLL